MLTNLNNVVRTQVSYYILTCVRVFLWKERIHSHSFDCIKNFIQHVFVGVFEKKMYILTQNTFIYV
ncbi:TPA: hypothetical protein PED25_001888 [Staphylococcus aureus]|nr:hypothetical protein [Staphylococcus aureus]